MYPGALAYIGGGILAINNIPQIVKVYRTKSAEDLSYLSLNLNIIGVGFMTVYGYVTHDYPLVTSTLGSQICTCVLLGLKVRQETTLS